MEKNIIGQHLKRILDKTDYKNIGTRKQGKVRDVYTQTDKVILITTDRLTGFDRLLTHIPFKGSILNLTSAFWFKQTADIIKNHIIDIPDANVTVGKKCKPILMECVVRGYLTGTTDTASWVRYSKGERMFGGLTLPDGMEKNQKLPRPIFDPTTKEDTHDRTLSRENLVKEGFISKELYDKLEKTALALFARGQEIVAKRGLILVDTKYEFGTDETGELLLIDEIHTPDSSRYWQEASYEERLKQGLEPENFDKEFIRLWFREHCDPYKDKVLPEAPDDLIAELSFRYIKIYEQITGEKFEADLTTPIVERISNNLKKYVL
jgi:phosphoribosylaminoimidazole-succinocarboxamide synthase